MKKHILTLALLFSVFLLKAQTDSILVNSQLKQIKIGSLIVAKDSGISGVIKLLGTNFRAEKNSSGIIRTYAYDDLGISFDIDPSGKKIEAVIINFNWDGDKKAAKSSFKGILKLDGYVIKDNTKADDINKNTQVNNIVCMGESLCMTPPGKPTLVVLIGYKDGKMSQIGFGIGN